MKILTILILVLFLLFISTGWTLIRVLPVVNDTEIKSQIKLTLGIELLGLIFSILLIHGLVSN